MVAVTPKGSPVQGELSSETRLRGCTKWLHVVVRYNPSVCLTASTSLYTREAFGCVRYPATVPRNRRTTNGRPYVGEADNSSLVKRHHERSVFILHLKRLPCARGAVAEKETEGLYVIIVCCCQVQSLRPFGPPPFAQGRRLGTPLSPQRFRATGGRPMVAPTSAKPTVLH